MKEILNTLIIVENDNQILLAKKQRKVGEGLWNGYGGQIEDGETVEEAAKRELFEESSLKVGTILERGVVKFINPKTNIVVYIFSAITNNEPIETEEMKNPTWFSKDNIPFDEMLPADRIWIPYFLKGKFFIGIFKYDHGWDLVDYSLETKTA